MFGIGPAELIIIALVAVVFVGPQRLPELMRQLGKFVVHAKRASTDIREAIDDTVKKAEKELALEEQRQVIKEAVQLADPANDKLDRPTTEKASKQTVTGASQAPVASNEKVRVEGSTEAAMTSNHSQDDENRWEKGSDVYFPADVIASPEAAPQKEGRGHVPLN